MRAETEGLRVDENTLAARGEIGAKRSLRCAVQMLTPAKITGETLAMKLSQKATLKM